MKYLISIFVFFFIFSEVKSQEIESVYLYKKDNKFENKYKNFIEKDSLVLFKDNTFKKIYSYFGFDEIAKEDFSGKWFVKKNSLTLIVLKRDSLKSKIFKPFEINYQIKKKKLISKSADVKNLKKLKF